MLQALPKSMILMLDFPLAFSMMFSGFKSQ